jgi:hypothetical protein
MIPPCSLTEIVKLNCDKEETSLGRLPLRTGARVGVFADGIGSSTDSRPWILAMYGAEIMWRLTTGDPLPPTVGDALQDAALQVANWDEDALAAVPPVAHFYAIGKAATAWPPDPLGLANAVNDTIADPAVQDWLGVHISAETLGVIETGIRIERIAEVPEVLAIEELSSVGAPFGAIHAVVQPVVQPPARAKLLNEQVAWDPGTTWPFQPCPPPKSLNDCVLNVMQRGGASQQAIAFARSQQGMVYARKFDPIDVVDLVEAVCTEGTNFNCGYSYFIVNGDPPAVEVGWREEDPALLSVAKSDITVDELNIKMGWGRVPPIWSGADQFVGAESSGGGVRLLFWSPMKFVHAGPPLARIYVAYDFDAQGRYLGRHFDHAEANADVINTCLAAPQPGCGPP